jgi:hypothetical protein
MGVRVPAARCPRKPAAFLHSPPAKLCFAGGGRWRGHTAHASSPPGLTRWSMRKCGERSSWAEYASRPSVWISGSSPAMTTRKIVRHVAPRPLPPREYAVPLPRFAGEDETPSLRQLRPDIHHRLQRRAQRVFALALRRRQRLPALPVAGELIAAAGAVPPAALLLFAGDPKPEQIALRLRHPGVAVLVGQPPPLRERPPAGIFLLLPHGSRSLSSPPPAGGRSPAAGRRVGVRACVARREFPHRRASYAVSRASLTSSPPGLTRWSMRKCGERKTRGEYQQAVLPHGLPGQAGQ